MDSREGEVVGELVLLEIGEGDGREGSKQRGAGIDGTIVDGVPYLRRIRSVLTSFLRAKPR